MITDLKQIIVLINDLKNESHQFIEESFRITIEGESLSINACNTIVALSSIDLFMNAGPVIRIDALNEVSTFSSFENSKHLVGKPWQIVLGKTNIATLLKIRPDEQTFLFFYQDALTTWMKSCDPFQSIGNLDPRFDGPITIRVADLDNSFGGPLLWILPIDNPSNLPQSFQSFPDSEIIQSVIHISSNRPLTINPKAVDLNWGALDSDLALSVLHNSAIILAASLCQELKYDHSAYSVIIRGSKKLTLPLFESSYLINNKEYSLLRDTVSWVYQERAETRHQLVMDRLSIDIKNDQTFIEGLIQFVQFALDQAKDSYAFVILERKDAYYKEVREIMKDMRAQADLYAAKTRDLISSLSRDILGVLVFIGFSFVSKFDRKNLIELISSREFHLLVKTLSVYYIISISLQIATHIRDSTLSVRETKHWIKILQEYTSKQDIDEKFNSPIQARRTTFIISIISITILYLILALSLWNLPGILNWGLHYPPNTQTNNNSATNASKNLDKTISPVATNKPLNNQAH